MDLFKIKKIFIFLLIPLYMACQKKDNNNSTIVEKDSSKFMEEVLVSQLKNGSKKYYKEAGIELPNDPIDIKTKKQVINIKVKELIDNISDFDDNKDDRPIRLVLKERQVTMEWKLWNGKVE